MADPPAVETTASRRISLQDLVDALAKLNDWERIEFCNALVDRPELQELLETIDNYLYVETDEPLLLNLLHDAPKPAAADDDDERILN